MHFLGFWILRPNAWLCCQCCKTQRAFLAKTANFFLQQKLQQQLHIQEMLESLWGYSLIWDIHSVLTTMGAEMLLLLLFELFLHVRMSGFTCRAVLYQKLFSQSHRPLAGKGTTLMRWMLERQVPTAHLDRLRKGDGNGINRLVKPPAAGPSD